MKVAGIVLCLQAPLTGLQQKRIAKTLERINRLGRQRHKQLTAIGAFKVAFDDMSVPLGDLEREYGKTATAGEVLRDHVRLSIKTLILKAWQRRRRVTTHISYELACFEEDEPQERNRILSFRRQGCMPLPRSVAESLRERADEVEAVRRLIKGEEDAGDSRPMTRRSLLRVSPITDRSRSTSGRWQRPRMRSWGMSEPRRRGLPRTGIGRL